MKNKMSLHLNLVLIFVLISFLSLQLQAKPIGVAIYDSPIDSSDPRLAGRLQISQSLKEKTRPFINKNYSQDNQILFIQLNNLIQKLEHYGLSPEEKNKMTDLQRQMSLHEFNNFMVYNHGQHVAGIAIKDTTQSYIVPVATKFVEFPRVSHEQIMKTLTLEQVDPLFLQDLPPQYYGLAEIKIPLYHAVLEELKGSPLLDLGILKNENVAVVNISLGSNLRSDLTGRLLDSWGESFRSSPPNAAAYMYVHGAQKYLSGYFYSQLMTQRDKLFVLASGNLMTASAQSNETSTAGPKELANDNDADPIFPISVMKWYKPSNLIVVAATVERKKLADFSGYGKTTVHVAAPGVDIQSFGQNGIALSLSGTSQATPYVSNTAAKMLERNPHLPPHEVKEIIMSTVDKKAFLTEKVISGGIVNPTRAIYAAELRKKFELQVAIEQSIAEVKDLD